MAFIGMEVFIQRNGTKEGPLSVDEVKTRLAKGDILLTDVICTSEEPCWRSLQDSTLMDVITPPLPNGQSPKKSVSLAVEVLVLVACFGVPLVVRYFVEHSVDPNFIAPSGAQSKSFWNRETIVMLVIGGMLFRAVKTKWLQ